MILRPSAARWFELVTVHRNLAQTLECLSLTGAVELEFHSDLNLTELRELPDIGNRLTVVHELARQYQSYWPSAASTEKRRSEQLSEVLSSAQQRLVTWGEKAAPIITSIEQLSRACSDLDQLTDALSHVTGDLPDLKKLVAAGPRLRAVLIQLPSEATIRNFPGVVLHKMWETQTSNFALVVGRKEDIDAIEERLSAFRGRTVPLPDWLPSSSADSLVAIWERRVQIARDVQELKDALAEVSDQLQIASALGDFALIEWYSELAKNLRGSRRLAWVSGWTNDLKGTTLRQALDAAGLSYVLRLVDAPAGTSPPMVLRNPRWARGFEIFIRMLGTPASDESDPSLILSILVPLIFGFMFGDVGQGLIVFIVGVTLSPRIPTLQILVPAGISAMAFGLLFGSVFSREDVIPALWLKPLAAPITVLTVALAAGTVILVIGLLLDATQAYWRGEAYRWWGCRAGLLVGYFGLLLAPFWLSGLAFAALGAAWFIGGSIAFAKEHGLRTIASLSAGFIEETLRLLVNTISFVRVGAFALAHAGLAVAIIDIAAAAGPVGYWIVLAFGNMLVIGLEGLIVSIQTTRLVLFEFFIRFLTARGRGFNPLRPPNITRVGVPSQDPGSM